MGRRTPLGKGMESLIGRPPPLDLEKGPEEPRSPKEGVFMVDVNTIHPNPYQPRKVFGQEALKELSDSIKENGIIQPLVVSKRPEGEGFTLIAGERRLRAAKLAQVTRVPVVSRRATDREKLVYAIIENIQRDELNCVEEALGYEQLLREFRLTQEQVAQKVGKERSTVANTLRILKLPEKIQELLKERKLSFGHGKLLASMKDKQASLRLGEECAREGLSVKELSERIKKEARGPAPRPPKARDRGLDLMRKKIEQTTGLHVDIQRNAQGQGKLTVHFSSEEELGHIFEYLTKR